MNACDKKQIAANRDSNRRASRLGYNAGLRGEVDKNGAEKTSPYPRALDGSGMANECFWHDAYWRGREQRVKNGTKPLGGLVNGKGRSIA